ncbi:MAG: EamA family transporter [Actinomycetes bacterium]
MHPTASDPARLRVGIAAALLSSAAFGTSGPFAKSLIVAGWSPTAVVVARLAGAALMLVPVAALTARRRVRIDARSARSLVVYGLVAMAGAQVGFFNAVRTLDVGVALLLEFLAPVLLLAVSSLRLRRLPSRRTAAGAALTLVGLALVLDLTGPGGLDPVGVLWGLFAAACLAGYFVLSARRDDALPPVVLAAGGTTVGAVAIAAIGATGALPLTASASDVTLAGATLPVLVPLALLVVISTVVAYVTGIAAVVRLGTRTSSFVALTEVLFAVLAAWLLLAELPGPMQLAGGVCIVTGIVLVQRGERVVAEAAPTSEAALVATPDH